jgi:MFS family permease
MILRRFAAILTGFISGFILVSLIQLISAKMYPPPLDLLPQDQEGMSNYFQSLPKKARFIVMSAHFVGTIFGAFIASKISDRYNVQMGLLVGFIMLVAAISYNSVTFAPGWMMVSDFLLMLLAMITGAKIGATKSYANNLNKNS